MVRDGRQLRLAAPERPRRSPLRKGARVEPPERRVEQFHQRARSELEVARTKLGQKTVLSLRFEHLREPFAVLRGGTEQARAAGDELSRRGRQVRGPVSDVANARTLLEQPSLGRIRRLGRGGDELQRGSASQPGERHGHPLVDHATLDAVIRREQEGVGDDPRSGDQPGVVGHGGRQIVHGGPDVHERQHVAPSHRVVSTMASPTIDIVAFSVSIQLRRSAGLWAGPVPKTSVTVARAWRPRDDVEAEPGHCRRQRRGWAELGLRGTEKAQRRPGDPEGDSAPAPQAGRRRPVGRFTRRLDHRLGWPRAAPRGRSGGGRDMGECPARHVRRCPLAGLGSTAWRCRRSRSRCSCDAGSAATSVRWPSRLHWPGSCRLLMTTSQRRSFRSCEEWSPGCPVGSEGSARRRRLRAGSLRTCSGIRTRSSSGSAKRAHLESMRSSCWWTTTSPGRPRTPG